MLCHCEPLSKGDIANVRTQKFHDFSGDYDSHPAAITNMEHSSGNGNDDMMPVTTVDSDLNQENTGDSNVTTRGQTHDQKPENNIVDMRRYVDDIAIISKSPTPFFL